MSAANRAEVETKGLQDGCQRESSDEWGCAVAGRGNTLPLGWFDAGPASSTLVQHQFSTRCFACWFCYAWMLGWRGLPADCLPHPYTSWPRRRGRNTKGDLHNRLPDTSMCSKSARHTRCIGPTLADHLANPYITSRRWVVLVNQRIFTFSTLSFDSWLLQ